MKLYHGSTEIIHQPLILDSQRLLDFGKGFYTTTNAEQAKSWAIIKSKRIVGALNAYVSVYDIDDNMLDSKDFNVKKFVKANEEWLDFVYENRKGLTTHKYDIVIGAVANDTLYQTLSLYESGILTKLETISRLKTHLLFDQISFHNADTLSRLKLIDYYKVDVK